MKPFEIFRTGLHTSSNGIEKEYSIEDLEQIADNYNRSEHDAPIVIGHPKSNAPAFGWIDKLFVEGDRLFAAAKDLAEDFINAVKDKRFSKRSISLTKDGLLNHVGFLGATIPAVKGLADVEFNEDDELTEFEMSNTKPESDKEDKEKEETTDQKSGASSAPVPQEAGTSRRVEDTDGGAQIKNYFENLSSTLTNVITEFKEIVNKNSESNLQFMNDNQEEIQKLNNKMSDLRAKIELSNFELMLTEKVANGYLTPAMKGKIVDLLNYFETLNFAETDRSTLSSDIQNLITEFINSTPKVFSFEETATKPEENSKPEVDPTFDDFELDPESAELHNSIKKTMQKEELTYEEAFYKVVNEEK